MNRLKNSIEMFELTSDSIFQDFSHELYYEKKKIEELIKAKINDLKQYNKFSFNTKIEMTDEDVYIDPTSLFTIDQIKEKLIFLRKQHIEFYEQLLEEYLKRKQDYDEIIKYELKDYFHYRDITLSYKDITDFDINNIYNEEKALINHFKKEDMLEINIFTCRNNKGIDKIIIDTGNVMWTDKRGMDII